MPRVPDYSNQASSTGLSSPGFSAPSVRNAAPQQIQQMGQQLEQSGQMASRITIDLQNQANQVRVNEAMNSAVAKKLHYTYDQADGYLNLKGEAALNRPDKKSLDDEYSEKLQKDLESIGAGLGNEAQRDIFKQQSAQLLGQFRGGLQEHVAKEYKSHQISVQDGTVDVAFNQVALGWDKPEEVAQGLGAIRAAVYEKGRLTGASSQQVVANTVASISPAHMSVISAALNSGKVAYAQEYYDQNKAELTPEARLRATKALEQGTNEMVAGAAVRELTAQPDWNSSEVDKQLVEQFKDKPDALKAARSELAYQDHLRKGAQQEQEDAAFKPVYSLLGEATQKGRMITRGESDSVLAPLRTSNPEAYAKASKLIDNHNDEVRSEYQASQDRARANAERYGANSSDAQMATWYQLKTDPAALKHANLLGMLQAGALSQKQFNGLVEDQQALISAKGSKEKEDTLLSDKAAIDLTLNAAGIKTGQKGDPAQLGKFTEKFDAMVKQQERISGKKLQQSEKVNIARELLKDVVIEKDWWPDSTKKAFEVDAAQPGTESKSKKPIYGGQSATGSITPKISKADHDQIVDWLKSKNLPVDGDSINRVYNEAMSVGANK